MERLDIKVHSDGLPKVTARKQNYGEIATV